VNRLSLISAALVIVVANTFALVHSERNRADSPEAELTLTNRELQSYNYSSPDDSGVTLHLVWTFWRTHVSYETSWLDRNKLQTLGFDCSRDPASPDAERFYQRQRPRKVFVALEYDGAAWRQWLESCESSIAPHGQFNYCPNSSHLVVMDADLDPIKLRALHPDRATVVILPALIRITNWTPDPQYPRQLGGQIEQIPTAIHVPLPFSDEFRRLNRSSQPPQPFRVHLRYGAFLEPWVTGVELGQ